MRPGTCRGAEHRRCMLWCIVAGRLRHGPQAACRPARTSQTQTARRLRRSSPPRAPGASTTAPTCKAVVCAFSLAIRTGRAACSSRHSRRDDHTGDWACCCEMRVAIKPSPRSCLLYTAWTPRTAASHHLPSSEFLQLQRRTLRTSDMVSKRILFLNWKQPATQGRSLHSDLSALNRRTSPNQGGACIHSFMELSGAL